MEVIKSVDNGLSYDLIGKQFNIGTTTVKDIISRRQKIQLAVSKGFGLSRKTLKEGKKPKVEEKLYSYVVEKIEQGEVVTNQELIGVASIMNQSMYNEKWLPSNGWLGKFKARYSLKNSKHFVKEENLSNQEVINDMPAVESEIDDVKDVAKISALNAADILLDFVNEFDFPLKEIITLRIIRDKISEMSEAQTMYEVTTRDTEDEDDSSEIGMKNKEDEENKN